MSAGDLLSSTDKYKEFNAHFSPCSPTGAAGMVARLVVAICGLDLGGGPMSASGSRNGNMK